jgi:hypothetical protein
VVTRAFDSLLQLPVEPFLANDKISLYLTPKGQEQTDIGAWHGRFFCLRVLINTYIPAETNDSYDQARMSLA